MLKWKKREKKEKRKSWRKAITWTQWIRRIASYSRPEKRAEGEWIVNDDGKYIIFMRCAEFIK